jgi:hypothetical protein
VFIGGAVCRRNHEVRAGWRRVGREQYRPQRVFVDSIRGGNATLEFRKGC